MSIPEAYIASGVMGALCDWLNKFCCFTVLIYETIANVLPLKRTTVLAVDTTSKDILSAINYGIFNSLTRKCK